MKLKYLREEAGLNQKAMADFLYIDQSMISKIESGARPISADALEKVASLFGRSIQEIQKMDNQTPSLNFAFRASAIATEDLLGIAAINKIALNIKQMNEMLEMIKRKRTLPCGTFSEYANSICKT